MLGVLLRRVVVVFGGMQSMPVRYAGVMRGLFVIAGFGVLSGFAMVFCRVFVMFGGMLVVLVNIVALHCRLPVGRFFAISKHHRDR
jgi:hypothetical protein